MTLEDVAPEESVAVLIVDDEANERALLRRALEDLPGDLVEAPDAETALNLARNRSFALAVLDVRMPGTDGFELASQMREDPELGSMPIIFLTHDLSDQRRVAKGYAAGAIDFLDKTLPDEILRAKVAAFIDLYMMRRKLIEAARHQERAAEQLRERQIYLERLREAIESFGPGQTDMPEGFETKAAVGAARVQVVDPKAFEQLTETYQTVLDDYMRHLTSRRGRPRAMMRRLADALGRVGAGPRDVLDLHVAALERKVAEVNDKRAEAYSLEGRLIALEVMGLLVDRYRLGTLGGRDA